MANKHPMSFRLADDVRDGIRELAGIQGGSQAEAVEYLVREWRRQHLSQAMAARMDLIAGQVADLRAEVSELRRHVQTDEERMGGDD